MSQTSRSMLSVRKRLRLTLRVKPRSDATEWVAAKRPNMNTVRAVLDALESRHPALRNTIRDHGTLKRRPFIRFFACKEDMSLEPTETLLPEAVVNGAEPFLIVGAMAGG